MKKRIRTNRMHSRILVSALIVLVGLGIGISCSKDTGVSSIDQTSTDDGVSDQRLVGTKPAVGGSNYADFHPQTGVNYDPFKGMTFDQRKAAVGGVEGAVQYLEVIATHLAHMMNDEKARTILQRVVPKSDEGEVHLTQILIENPYLLTALSSDFKDNIDDKAIGAQLSQVIGSTESNGEAILKASKALLDLMVSVASPDGGGWGASDKIPVFFVPANDDNGATMQGVDADLNTVSFVIDGKKLPYSFLYLNYDENSPMVHAGRQVTTLSLHPESPIKSLWASWQRTLKSISLVPSAEAHNSGGYHGPHYDLVQPVQQIIIFDAHEPVGNPDIWLYLTLRIHPDEDIYYEQSWSLVDVDEINVTYTNYDYIRATHGVAYEWNYDYVKEVRIMEGDGFANEDDELGTWGGHPRLIYLGPHPRHRANRLEDYEATGVTQPADAEVVIVRTYDTWDPDDVGR